MIDLRKLAKTGEKYAFGTEREKVAALLREMADKIAAGMILPQTIIHQQHATVEDYTGAILLIEYAEKMPD